MLCWLVRGDDWLGNWCSRGVCVLVLLFCVVCVNWVIGGWLVVFLCVCVVRGWWCYCRSFCWIVWLVGGFWYGLLWCCWLLGFFWWFFWNICRLCGCWWVWLFVWVCVVLVCVLLDWVWRICCVFFRDFCVIVCSWCFFCLLVVVFCGWRGRGGIDKVVIWLLFLF